MTTLRVLAMRVKAFFLGSRSDRDLDDDIRAHLDLLTQEYVRRGLSSEDAYAAARRAFGGAEQMKEIYRDSAACRSSTGSCRTFDMRVACVVAIQVSRRSRSCRWLWASGPLPPRSVSSMRSCCGHCRCPTRTGWCCSSPSIAARNSSFSIRSSRSFAAGNGRWPASSPAATSVIPQSHFRRRCGNSIVCARQPGLG